MTSSQGCTVPHATLRDPVLFFNVNSSKNIRPTCYVYMFQRRR